MKTFLHQSTHPELVREWSDINLLRPENVTTGSGRKVEWVCSQQGHVYEAIVKNRVKGSGCPYCSGKKVLRGFNDLVTTHPHLVSEWMSKNEVKATEVSAGSQQKASWICTDCSRKWVSSVYSRAVLESGCPYCTGQKVVQGINDLVTTHPQLASSWHHDNTLQPEEVSAGSQKNVLWKCLLVEEHQWPAIVASRVRGSGCPYCSGRKASEHINDLATTHPEIASEWLDVERDVTSVSAGSDYKAWWQCPVGHRWKCSVYLRTKRGVECDVCNNRRLLLGDNDLATTHSELAAEWSPDNDVTPEEVIAGSSKRVEWVCRVNGEHKWKTTVSNRTLEYLSTGCPHCYAKTFVSKGESEIYEYIKELLSNSEQITVQQSARGVIAGRELDIYVPELNFAVEYNGLYWHSETNGKDKWYHYNKYADCKDRGIKLFQVWEDDYMTNRTLVEKMIAHQLKMSTDEVVYARNTRFAQVRKEEAREFLGKNHLQGMNYASRYYGLRRKSDDLLVALIGLQRKKNNSELEISRFATQGRVVGAFTKLLKNSLKEPGYSEAQNIVSYSHNDHSWGGLYQKNGFLKIHDGAPGYFYFTQGQLSREFRRSYSLDSFKERDDLLYQEGLTERQLAGLNGLHRIWDSGSARWEKQL